MGLGPVILPIELIYWGVSCNIRLACILANDFLYVFPGKHLSIFLFFGIITIKFVIAPTGIFS